MTETISLEAAVARVNALVPDEIADLIRKEGIKGVPTNGFNCPLARYLSKMTGMVVRVGGSAIVWTDRPSVDNNFAGEINPEYDPQYLQEGPIEFTHLFDNRMKYSDLVEEVSP